MLKRILVKGPLLSRSGYGEQSRFALRALRSRPDLYDIYMINTAWGRTGQISDTSEETQWIQQTLLKTSVHTQSGGTFEVSLQVTVPNEFEKLCPINIGYTAGIETTKVSPQWIEKTNTCVDKVVVVSNHSKRVFEQTTYNIQDGNGNKIDNWGVTVPIDAVNYPVRTSEPVEVDINFKTTENFLAVSQWGPRKNLDNTIRWFVDNFRDREDVGLVIKTNMASDSVMDRIYTQKRMEAILNTLGDKKCSIYLIHGEMEPGALTWLYQHPTMKALINIGHGEGYGLPMFEAVYNGLPLITTTWSGQMDFITKPNKKGKQVPRVLKVDYDVLPVQQEAVWDGIIQKDSSWAFAKEASFKRALDECLEKETHWKKEATTLMNHVLANFTDEKIYNDFIEAVEFTNADAEEMNNWLVDLQDGIEEYE